MLALLLATLVAVKLPTGMVSIPAGSYRPLFSMTGAAATPTRVAAFAIDREPVTRGDFLRFVRAHPSWRRSAVSRDLAEASYLTDWRGDLDAGDAAALR